MEFFKNIKQSIYGPDYYQKLLSKPFSYSLKYYFLFILLLSLVASVLLSFYFIPRVALFADVISTKVVSHYPAELKVTIQNGKVSTNVHEPYFVAMPSEFKNDKNLELNGVDAKEFKNLVVIDTKSDFSIEQFQSYDTALLLTRDSLVMSGENGKITLQPLDSNVNFVLDKPTVEFFVAKIKPFLTFLYPLVFVVAFVVCLVALVFHLVYLLFGAFLVWIVVKAKKMSIGYGKSYQLGMHLMTFGILITTALTLLNIYAGIGYSIPFFFSIVLVIMAVVNIKKPVQENIVQPASI